MKSEVMWDNIAKTWDKPGVSLGENDLRIIKRTKKYLDANSVVLDYGCATGSIALELGGMVKAVRGIDLSSNMIALARKKAEERSITNVEFTHAALFDKSLEPESFDVILALSILHLLENFPQVMNRIHQLLKPRGVFISATPCLGEKTFISLLVNLPVFLLSKIKILPHVNFFSVHDLNTSITNEHFQILENENLEVRPIVEHFLIAQKQ